MSSRKGENDVKLRLGALKDQAQVMAVKRGFKSLAPYLRELIARGLERDREAFPGMCLFLRPQATVFREVSADVYSPLAQGIGGERVWVLAVVTRLPSSMGGELGYVCDITAGDTAGGLEGRGVIVKASDLGGA